MEEKIKIYVPEGVDRILKKDMELFEFYKKDGALNRNSFYNTLIVNYYETYQALNEKLFQKIKALLEEEGEENDELAYRLLQAGTDPARRLDSGPRDVTVSIKPTRTSASVFRYIEDILIRNQTVSGYFRELFASYSLLPQDRRERILFKDKFEVLDKAIRENRKVYFRTGSSDAMHIVSPYLLADSKEELFNYLLCEYRDLPYSFRVSRMEKIVLMNETAEISKETKQLLDKMKKNGPQFAYDARRKDALIKVSFTPRGEEMFKKIYLHRPSPIEKNGNVYTFDCSAGQAYQYFSRFSRNAVILEPKDLQEDMMKFYTMGTRAYQKYRNRDGVPSEDNGGN